MTYNEFKNKYNGKYTDFDGAYGCQCWDLAQRYITEVLGLPRSFLDGSGLVSNMLYQPKRAVLDKYFDQVPLTNMAQGDIIIWSWGHIAIYDHWDGHNNWYFSQNPNPCQVMCIRQDGQYAFRKKAPKPTYPTGNYVCDYNMRVRTGAGVNFANKKVRDLSVDGKRHATSTNPNDDAIYKKGTVFTAKEIIINGSSVWGRSPSGYICIKDGTTTYCRKA